MGHGVREEQEVEVDKLNPFGGVKVDIPKPFGGVMVDVPNPFKDVKVDIPNPFGELSEIDFSAALNAAPLSEDLKIEFPEHQQSMDKIVETKQVMSKDFATALNRAPVVGDRPSEFAEHKPTMEINFETTKVQPFQPLQLICTLCDNSQQWVYKNKSSLSKHLKSQHNLSNQQIVEYYLAKPNPLPSLPEVNPSPVSEEDSFINSLIEEVGVQMSNEVVTSVPKGWKVIDRGIRSRELRKIVPKPPSYNFDNSNGIQPTTLYDCDKCEMKFSYIGALDKHMLSHGGQTAGTYECPHCDVQYFTMNALKVHMNENLMVVAMLCGINGCNSRFMARCEGSRHQRDEHGLQGKKIKLDQTTEEVATKVTGGMSIDFGRDINMETTEGPEIPAKQVKSTLEGTKFVIEETEESEINDPDMLSTGSKIRNDLNMEFVPTDDPTRRFGCKDCGKTYITKNHIAEHMVQHTGVFPFNCTACKVGFIKK